MSENKSSLLNKRISQFFDSTTELLTDIHARNKDASNKGTAKQKRKMKKVISIPDPDIDLPDDEPCR
jgi:hypothetical protein